MQRLIQKQCNTFFRNWLSYVVNVNFKVAQGVFVKNISAIILCSREYEVLLTTGRAPL